MSDNDVLKLAFCPTCGGKVHENVRSAAASAEPVAWQPIETAPEDVPVWGWQPPQDGLHDCYGNVALLEKVDGAWFTHHDGEETFEPTCWMPANKPKRPHSIAKAKGGSRT